MTRFCTFASGSTGNAALVSSGGTHILIDMGISCRRIVQSLSALGLTPEDLAAVLITHEHNDHIAGLATYIKKYKTPVITTSATARQLAYRLAGIEPQLRCVEWGESCSVGSVTVQVLESSHDCAGTCGFLMETESGTLGYLTDTGCIPSATAETLLGAKLLVLESNHDVDRLLSGPYPYYLKDRVLSMRGHLSNEVAAAFAADSIGAGTEAIVLAHLSQENNTPQLALRAFRRWLEPRGYCGKLIAAPAGEMSELVEME